MLIRLSHQKFSTVELRGESLIIHSMQGEGRVLRENVKDVVATMQDSQIRIVAFLNGDYAWFFSGRDELQSEMVELGQPYGGGGQLVTDGLGNSHLFYFVNQSPGHSALLRHQVFSGEWSKPQTVSTNVFPGNSSYSASWHDDHYLHLVYLGHNDQHLLYRVYNMEHGVWSGAVSFSEARCSYPQLISADRLYLFWQEETDPISIRVREKDQTWSSTKQVSTGEYHAASVGYSFEDNNWSVFWMEGSHFYKASFGEWSQREQVDRADFDYAWFLHGGLTIPMYTSKQVTEPAPVPAARTGEAESVVKHPEPIVVPQSEEKQQEQQRRESEEAKLQAAFIEKAFRTLKEWETVREEMDKWKREFRLPDPVDLTPLTTRLERLERRFVSLKQNQEQAMAQWEVSVQKTEEELFKARARLRELEDAEKRKAPSLWRRVLGRG
ncbi:MAG: hypothetical protein GX971_09800 [Firmicutes bacterium]|nr:hypothetical protein [Bacillota bacterium]